jgi:hypothetical protein
VAFSSWRKNDLASSIYNERQDYTAAEEEIFNFPSLRVDSLGNGPRRKEGIGQLSKGGVNVKGRAQWSGPEKMSSHKNI